MANPLHLEGQKFGRLLVLKRAGSRNQSTLWLCRCDCGNEKLVLGWMLRRKVQPVQSCGCLQREAARETGKRTVAQNRRPPLGAGDLKYHTVHARLHVRRGSPSDYPCLTCCGRAQHWVFQHDTPPEFVKTSSEGYFSTRMEDYAAMCVRCHALYDREHGKGPAFLTL